MLTGSNDGAARAGSRRRVAAPQIATRACAAVVAVSLLFLLYNAWQVSAAPWMRGAIVVALALAALRPRDALLAVAGLAPLAGAFGATVDAPLPARDVLMLATVAGWALRAATVRPPLQLLPSDLAAPVTCFAVVILTSAAVELWGQRELLGSDALSEEIDRSLDHGLLRDRHSVRGLHATWTYLEGLVVFSAVVCASAGRRAFAARVATMAVLGAIGAAALNLLRVATVSIASPTPLARLRELLGTVRVNVHFADVNAAGSYFAMMCLAPAALAGAGSPARSLGWSLGAAVIFAAAWLTGSRAAVAAILIVGVAMMLTGSRPTGARRAPTWIVAAAALALAVIFVAAFPNRLFGDALTNAVSIRAGLARVSLSMFADHPLFGVGVGGFYDSSAPYLERSAVGKVYLRENAHNNFLQVLGELGAVGLLVLIWWLWRIAARIWRARPLPYDPLRRGVAAGVLAFALTATLGHPLLTPEVSGAFWLMLGVAAGLYPREHENLPPARRRYGVLLFAVGMVALVPLRAERKLDGLDLEHIRHGVSRWTVDDQGVRYQTFGRSATLFASEGNAAVIIPIREPNATADARIEVRLDGRLVDMVRTDTSWRDYPLRLVGEPERGRFFRIELTAPPDAADGRTREVWVGRLGLIPSK